MCLLLPNNYLLEVKDLYIEFERYAGSAKVLNGVSLNISARERVGLVGESGCGKSLTVKTIMGLLPEKRIKISGEIKYKGQEILEANDALRKKITGKEMVMIFQDPMTSLNPVFSIEKQMMENIWWNYYPESRGFSLFKKKSKKKKAELKALIEKTLKEVRLSDTERILNSYPFQLSGGMRQRVLIAMALASQPSLLIADEPGTALDVTTQKQIVKLLDELIRKKDLATLMITHNLGLVRENTDKVYIMYGGNIVESAATEKIFTNPLHPYTRGLLDSVPKLTAEGVGSGIEGTVPNYFEVGEGCRFEPRCSYRIEKCKLQNPELKAEEEGHFVACYNLPGKEENNG